MLAFYMPTSICKSTMSHGSSRYLFQQRKTVSKSSSCKMLFYGLFGLGVYFTYLHSKS